MEIFKLYGSIFVDADQAKKSISDTSKNAEALGKKMQQTGSKISSVGAGITKGAIAVGAAVTGVVGGVTAIATKASSAADEIDKMSQRLGLSREAYQKFDYVLSQSGVDINSFQTGMKSLLKNMDAFAEGNKTATANFEKLGVAVLDANGNMRSQEEVLLDTVRAFQSMTDSSEKARLAQEVFGKQGQEILPLLNAEAGSVDELMNKAKELGLVMSDEAIDAGVKFTDTMDTLKKSTEMLATQLGAELLPYVQKGAEYLIEHMPEIRDTIEKLIPPTITIIEGLASLVTWFANLGEGGQKAALAFGVFLAALGPIITVIGGLITFVGQLQVAWALVSGFITGTVIPALSAVAAALSGPIIVAIGLVVAAIAVWVKNWEAIKEATRLYYEEMGYFFDNIVAKVKNAFNTIKELIKLPHFSISGEFSLKPLNVPTVTVDWYAKAMNAPMIMTSPTVFGVNGAGQPMAGGEAGSEIVSGTDTLMAMIKSATISKEEMQSAMVAALSYVFENNALNVDVAVSADKDGIFKAVKEKNTEFKQRNGASAFA